MKVESLLFWVKWTSWQIFFSTAVRTQENGLSIWRCSRTYVCVGEHPDRDWSWNNKKLDRFVSWTQAQMADAADALVALWDQYTLNYVFPLLKLWTRLLHNIVDENIPVIIMAANWPWSLGEYGTLTSVSWRFMASTRPACCLSDQYFTLLLGRWGNGEFLILYSDHFIS